LARFLLSDCCQFESVGEMPDFHALIVREMPEKTAQNANGEGAASG
jgi:hypothetical protein